MLVLSRRKDEQIVLPELGITLTLLNIKGQQAKIGISAPKSIRIVRGELETRHSVSPDLATTTPISVEQFT